MAGKSNAKTSKDKQDQQQPVVAYETVLNKIDVSIGNNKALQFDRVELNDGDAYNRKTGIFTTPVAGTYHFWALIMNSNAAKFDLYLIKEGSVIGEGFIQNSAKHGTSIISHVRKLKKGDKVWFVCREYPGTVLRGMKFSNYGGSLLYV